MLLHMAAHGGHRAQLHHIQHRRDGAHVILAQQQPQQSQKMLRLPVGFPQHIIELLQGRQQDLPELVQDLGIPSLQLPGQLLQSPLHAQIFQEAIQSLHLLAEVDGSPQSLAQTFQGGDELLPLFIQLLQTAAGGLRPFRPQAIRVVFPRLQPLTAPDAPEKGIVFQQVAGIQIHAGQSRAEVAEHTALVKIAEGGIQGGEHRGDHALLQNILGAGLVGGDVHSGENQLHQGLVLSHIGADQSDVPIAAALLCQFPDGAGGGHDLCPGRIRPDDR